MRPIAAYLKDLESGAASSARLVQDALDRACDPAGEGARVFTRIYKESAPVVPAAVDAQRAAGLESGPLAGIPISIKDLFDVAHEPTNAGSVLFADGPPAAADAAVVRRLRQAGAVLVGRTNMTEFAFSGIGLNPHYGTPRNPFDRAVGRIPGGSSSGGAVSVSDGMAAAAICSDTGGSARIPAALCGLAGFKPTAVRVPAAGMLPLSTSLDAVGIMAPTVACCARVDSVIADQPAPFHEIAGLGGLRLGVLQGYVLDGLDDSVAADFSAALSILSAGGASVQDLAIPELGQIPLANAKGGFPAPEAYAWHRELLEHRGAEYDQRVYARILAGSRVAAADYIQLIQARARITRGFDAAMRGFDAVLMPTVPRIAPTIASLAEPYDEAFFEANAAMLRSPAVVNFIDGCALSIPCHRPGLAPVGLTLFGSTHGDGRLLSVGLAVERALAAEGRSVVGG